MEHCCRTVECRRERLLMTCLLTVVFSSGCVYSNVGHFFNMATIQEESTIKKNHENGKFVNCHGHVYTF